VAMKAKRQTYLVRFDAFAVKRLTFQVQVSASERGRKTNGLRVPKIKGNLGNCNELRRVDRSSNDS
jgi:hypothetical protein